MLTERPLSTDLKAMLLAQTPFQYAHLVKFERPSRPDTNTGQVSTSKQAYTYITDASRDVVFDDGSTDLLGVANGAQTYVANKVMKVSSVQEDTEAKASAYSLVLDGNGLGATVSTGNATIVAISAGLWEITFPSLVNLLSYGFRELDKVTLSGATSGLVNIQKFRAPNVIRVTKINTDIAAASGALQMDLSSDEIVSILLDKNSTNYSSFVNREVYIYRAYFQEGSIVGSPFLLFKGIISGVGFDDSDTTLAVTWNLTSHWGDFSQVKGRITSDDFHRALDQNGVPQPQSALKVAYAYDKGFIHAETSINILAQYSVQVEKQDVKVKKGFLGIGSKVKVKKYYVTESRNTELDFQLQAKAIPVLYGVRNITGIPVFADTLNDDSSTVYVIHAISEGEIGGIYDVYIDGNSLICNDKADFDTRSTQTDTDTVSLICRGRADRGDVLGGVVSTGTTSVPFYDYYPDSPTTPYRAALPYDLNSIYKFKQYVQPTVANTDNTGSGVFNGNSITLTSPQDITLDVFSGKPGQKAASSLVTIAKQNNFKIQNDYWTGPDTADYWGPNHRLLDTAYVVAKYLIKEGETSIPELEFIARGKTINCYNYDKSYSHYIKATTENAGNFLLGDVVSLKQMDGTVLVASTQIIDKWNLRNADGSLNTRFRFDVDPPLQDVNGIPAITQFQMVKGSNTWTMITHNYRELQSLVPAENITPITSASNNNGYVQFGFANNPGIVTGGDPAENSSVFSVSLADGTPVTAPFFSTAVLVGAITTTTLLTSYSWSAAGTAASASIGNYLVCRNTVALPSTAVTTDGYYNGYMVTLTRTDSITGKRTVQSKQIIDYIGGSLRVATIDGLWDYGFHPKVGDNVSLAPAYADSRISINPAIQLMDYITSPTYGRGLSHTRDLNLPSWLDTARICDTQSDVTVQLTSSPTLSAGAVYRWPASGAIVWQGTVVGASADYVQFTSILGKLTYNWNSWRNCNTNEIVYSDNNLYLVTTPGVVATQPTHTSGTVGNLQALSSINLTKVSGTGPATLGTRMDGNPVRALKNGSNISGYSLYDADGINYWRYIGWDEFAQRYATQNQTNISIDTSISLLDNVNSLLEHFGGILRYSGGQYYLDIEAPQGLIDNSVNEARNITSDHIIGKIRLTDEGIRTAFNSLTASYADPANKFEARNISFFNSDYLKADRGVPKKGNITVPGVTNYYNTRLLADKMLNKSRFGLQIAFNMTQRGTILLAGQVVQLQYPRYNWSSKKFRITTLTHVEDATTDIVAEEYDDSFYGLSNISKQAAAGLAGSGGSFTGIGSPSNLKASSVDTSDETNSAVSVTWTNNPAANTKNVYTEVYSSYSSHLYVDVASISSNTITTVENPHMLKVGELITSMNSINGLQANKNYFVLATPAANTLQLSTSKGGSITPLINGTNVDALLQTASLIATVPIPTNSYIDVFGGIDSRVVKYYWLRHKVIQES